LAEDETDLRLFPPLRASWSPRGWPEQVELSGANAKRVLFGCLNIRTGHRLRLVRGRQRGEDFQAVLDLVHGSYRAWNVTLLLDEDRSHTAGASRALAAKHRIDLEWLPKRSPHLNPMDHLWRYPKGAALANRQEASIDDLVKHALATLDNLSNTDALNKAGLLSPDCWLRSVL
jgi:hypothetical protein